MEFVRVIYEDLTPFEKSAINAVLFAKGVDACVELQAFLDACSHADEEELAMLHEAYLLSAKHLCVSDEYH